VSYTYYDYLEVAPGAPPARIEAAYAQILERFGYGVTESGQDLGNLVRLIHAAHDVLSDPEARRRYDAQLERAAAAADAELKGLLDQQAPWPTRRVQDVPFALASAMTSLAA
jgi:DnaJ-class molecular chaperone